MRRYLIPAVLTAAILGPVGALAQTANIDNGVAGAGHLDVNVDAYGAFGNWNAAYTDNFEPSVGGAGQPTFSAGFRLFSGNDRVLLTDMPEWNAALPGGTWFRGITVPIFNVNAFTTSSSFDIFGVTGARMLSFDVRQTVSSPAAGVALLDQSYAISNVSGSALAFEMNRVLDADLVYGGSPFDDDHVGASNPLGWVIQHEGGIPSQTLAMTSGPGGTAHNFYWGGKNTHVPTGGGPAFGFGSDNVVWNNGGLPTTWQNYIAYWGYNIAGGDSGFVAGQDAHIGLDWQLNLANGGSTVVNVRTAYGAVPEPGSMIALSAGLLILARRRRRKTAV